MARSGGGAPRGGGGPSMAARGGGGPSMPGRAGGGIPAGGGRSAGPGAGGGGIARSGTLPSGPRGGVAGGGRAGVPGAGGGRAAGPGTGGGIAQGGGRGPTQGQLNDFLDPGGGGGTGRPATRPSGGGAAAMAGGALAGGAAAAFLHENQGERPGGGEARPGGDQIATLPGPGGRSAATRPGAGGEGVRRGGEGRGGEGRGTRPGEAGEGSRRGGEDGRGRDGQGIRPGQDGGGQQFRPGGGEWANHTPGRIQDRNQWNNWRQNNITNVNNHWNNNWRDHDGWFNNDWWNNHRHDHFLFDGNVNWWAWAAWPTFTKWFPWGWNQPVYYNYGYPDSVYYVDNTVYSGSQPVATTQEYAQQAEQIATSIPQNVTPAASDWLPLGVFALTNDGQPTGADPTMYLQLTVSKQGIIAGTLQNTDSGVVKSVEGMVDKDSQRAAWTAVGATRPLMETGISNLTQDSAPALVHFADGTTQQWLLVRLKKPVAQQ